MKVKIRTRVRLPKIKTRFKINRQPKIRLKADVRTKLNFIDILAILVFMVVFFDIPFLGLFMNSMLMKVGAFAIAVALEVGYAVKKKIILQREHLYLLLIVAIIFMVTVLRGGSLTSYASYLGPVVAACFMIIICRKPEDFDRLVKIWTDLLFVLLIIDLITIVLFPKGLYRGTYIRNNWFLGYKTFRLMYTLTLLSLYNYYDVLKNGVLSKKSIKLAVVVGLDTILCRGTSATIIMFAYIAAVWIMFGKRKDNGKGFFRRFVKKIAESYALFLLLYLFAFFMIVVLRNTTIVNKIIVGLFHKSFSFGERAIAWKNIMKALHGNLLFGLGMINRENYMEMTGGYANAHNTLFTYLIAGGLVCLVILLRVVVASLREARQIEANLIISTYFYGILFLGVTSSALAFCPYFFALLLIPLNKHILPDSYGGNNVQCL